ncbi:MAG: nucleotidyltransferase family protein [Pseudomonadota bacterium]
MIKTPEDIKKTINFYEESGFDGFSKKMLMECDEKFLFYFFSVLFEEASICECELSLEKWRENLAFTNRNNASFVFYYKLKKNKPQFMPPDEILGDLRSKYLSACCASLASIRQLNELFSKFNEEKLSVIVFKGPALDQFLYPQQGLRVFSDIDLLVNPKQYNLFHKAIGSLSYFSKYDSKIMKKIQELHIEETFYNKKNNYKAIDLHWSLNAYKGIFPKLKTKVFFEKSVEHNKIRIFDLIDTFISLSIHLLLTHENEIVFIRIYDLYLALQKIIASGDVSELFERAAKNETTVLIKKAISLVLLWTDLEISEDIQRNYNLNEYSKEEIKILKYISKRHKNPFYWLKVRLPKDKNILSSLIMLIRYAICRKKYKL